MRCIRAKRLLAIWIILIGGSAALADKPAKPLAIDDVFNLRLAADPQISPSFSVAKNGAYAVTYTRPNVPGDIAVCDRDSKAPRVVTAVNEGLLSGRTLGEVEAITYESSKDKRKIQGWIIKPPGFDP